MPVRVLLGDKEKTMEKGFYMQRERERKKNTGRERYCLCVLLEKREKRLNSLVYSSGT